MVSPGRVCSFIGVPFDGAATLGWPGARYGPGRVRHHLDWMRMRSEEGRLNEAGLTEIPAATVLRSGVESALEVIADATAAADHRFVAVDIDVLDPAYAPGVGWHEPGGLTTRMLLDFLVALAPGAAGMCLNEVNPMTDAGEQTSILAANLVFHFAVAAVTT